MSRKRLPGKVNKLRGMLLVSRNRERNAHAIACETGTKALSVEVVHT